MVSGCTGPTVGGLVSLPGCSRRDAPGIPCSRPPLAPDLCRSQWPHSLDPPGESRLRTGFCSLWDAEREALENGRGEKFALIKKKKKTQLSQNYQEGESGCWGTSPPTGKSDLGRACPVFGDPQAQDTGTGGLTPVSLRSSPGTNWGRKRTFANGRGLCPFHTRVHASAEQFLPTSLLQKKKKSRS